MWHIAILDGRQHEQFSSVRGRFALQKPDAASPWQFVEDADEAHDETIQPLSGVVTLSMRPEAENLRLDCRGTSSHVELPDGAAFWTGKAIQLPLPCLFRVGDAWVEVRETSDAGALGLEPLRRRNDAAAPGLAAPGPDAKTVSRWMTAVSKLHRLAASSPEFFTSAAELTLGCTGLDAAMVLVRRDGDWHIGGSTIPHPEFGVSYHPAAVALALDGPDVWRSPGHGLDAADDESASAASPQSLVVAPVVDKEGDVVAAVYGMRHGQGDNRRRGIRVLEARVVALMADAVGVGIARREQEIESARQQVLLEQAFPPAVVDQIRRRPETLAGRTRDASLLFADLRGFTAVDAALSPADAYELLGDVLETLTQAVTNHGGVVIDYYGDGLSAMWNAPFDVDDHADKACAAAMQMLDGLPAISDRWRERASRALELGIGIHTGDVQVGNAGTSRRLKYGPRGSAVNLASRVQAATRHVDVPLLVTAEVRRRLSSRFVTLRTCTAKLPGLDAPVELFAVFPATDGERLQSDLERYSAALTAFEAGDLDEAERILAELLKEGPATPAAFLFEHAAALRQGEIGRSASDRLSGPRDAVVVILAK